MTPDEPNAASQPTQPSSGEAPTSPPEPSSPAESEQPRDTEGKYEVGPDKWRYPMDHPVEWQRGRTAAEVGELSNQMYQMYLSGQGAPQPQQPQYPTQQHAYPQQQPPQPQVAPPTPDEWSMDPATAYQKQLAYDQATKFDPVIRQQQEMLAQTGRELARMKYKDEFTRWGPEIDILLQQVPVGQRTSQTYDMVVDMVRGRHAREIQQEEVERAIAQRLKSGDVTRPQPAAGQGTTVPADGRLDLDDKRFPSWWRDWCKTNNVDGRVMDDWLMQTKFYGSDLAKARETYMRVVERDGTIEGASDVKKR